MLRLHKQTTLTVKRNQGNYNASGKWVAGSGADPITIECSFQPTTGADLNKLPSGYTSTEIKKIFTDTELKAEDEDNGVEADIINDGTHDWKVLNVQHWSELRLAHYEVLIGREEKR